MLGRHRPTLLQMQNAVETPIKFLIFLLVNPQIRLAGVDRHDTTLLGDIAPAYPVKFHALLRFLLSVKLKVEPLPTWLCTLTLLSCASTICLTIANPNPVPPTSRERSLSTR